MRHRANKNQFYNGGFDHNINDNKKQLKHYFPHFKLLEYDPKSDNWKHELRKERKKEREKPPARKVPKLIDFFYRNTTSETNHKSNSDVVASRISKNDSSKSGNNQANANVNDTVLGQRNFNPIANCDKNQGIFSKYVDPSVVVSSYEVIVLSSSLIFTCSVSLASTFSDEEYFSSNVLMYLFNIFVSASIGTSFYSTAIMSLTTFNVHRELGYLDKDAASKYLLEGAQYRYYAKICFVFCFCFFIISLCMLFWQRLPVILAILDSFILIVFMVLVLYHNVRLEFSLQQNAENNHKTYDASETRTETEIATQ